VVGNLPNILTLLRILLLPVFAAALIYGNSSYALIIFLAASVTDILDGQIARMKKQITVFGSILDPVADKFFMLTAFIIMAVYGWIPKWLTIIVISRDLIIVTGWLILSFVTHDPKVEPNIFGKISSALQFFLIGLVLLSINMGESFSVPDILMFIVAIFTAISGVFYIYRGFKAADVEGE
jgi:cardiolipin synthase